MFKCICILCIVMDPKRFLVEIRLMCDKVMASFTTFFSFFSNMSVFPSFTTILVVVTNAFSVSSKSPLVFLTLSLGLPNLVGNGSLILDDVILVLDILRPVNSIISSRF